MKPHTSQTKARVLGLKGCMNAMNWRPSSIDVSVDSLKTRVTKHRNNNKSFMVGGSKWAEKGISETGKFL